MDNVSVFQTEEGDFLMVITTEEEQEFNILLTKEEMTEFVLNIQKVLEEAEEQPKLLN